MARPKRKDYIALPSHTEPDKCQAMYFHTQAEAAAWLQLNGGGKIRRRGAGSTFVPGFGRVTTWGDVQTVPAREYPPLSSDGEKKAEDPG